jgi:hypothetical protein
MPAFSFQKGVFRIMRPTCKKALAFAMLCLFLPACLGGGKRLLVSYAPVAGTVSINPASVQLKVIDERADKSLVGPGAMEKDLFKASQTGAVDLEVTLPYGQKAARTALTSEQMVFEAVKERLKVLGISASSGEAGAKAVIEVKIAELHIDAKGSEVAARCRLETVIRKSGGDYPPPSRSWSEADSSRRKLIGDMGGAEALSEAISIAVNGLNFASLDQY